MNVYQRMARNAEYCGKAQKVIYKTHLEALVGMQTAYDSLRALRSDTLHVYRCELPNKEIHYHIGHPNEFIKTDHVAYPISRKN